MDTVASEKSAAPEDSTFSYSMPHSTIHALFEDAVTPDSYYSKFSPSMATSDIRPAVDANLAYPGYAEYLANRNRESFLPSVLEYSSIIDRKANPPTYAPVQTVQEPDIDPSFRKEPLVLRNDIHPLARPTAISSLPDLVNTPSLEQAYIQDAVHQSRTWDHPIDYFRPHDQIKDTTSFIDPTGELLDHVTKAMQGSTIVHLVSAAIAYIGFSSLPSQAVHHNVKLLSETYETFKCQQELFDCSFNMLLVDHDQSHMTPTIDCNGSGDQHHLVSSPTEARIITLEDLLKILLPGWNTSAYALISTFFEWVEPHYVRTNAAYKAGRYPKILRTVVDLETRNYLQANTLYVCCQSYIIGKLLPEDPNIQVPHTFHLPFKERNIFQRAIHVLALTLMSTIYVLAINHSSTK
jgi:hypothetical protein